MNYFNNQLLTEEQKIECGYFKTNVTIPSNLGSSLIDMDQFKENDIILLNCGSFNPFHKGHYDMYNNAIKALKLQKNTNVHKVAIPAHNAYLKAKKGDKALRHDIRIKHILDNYPDVIIDPWVCYLHNDDVNLIDIIIHWYNMLSEHIKSNKFRLICLVSSETANMANILQYVPELNIEFVIINRPDYELTNLINDSRIHFYNKNKNNTSSTGILAKSNVSKTGFEPIKKYYLRYDLKNSFHFDIIKTLLPFLDENAVVELNDIHTDFLKYKEIITQKTGQYGSNIAFVFLDTQMLKYETELKNINKNVFFHFCSRVFEKGGYKVIQRISNYSDLKSLDVENLMILDDDQFYLDENYKGLDKTLNYVQNEIKQFINATNVMHFTLRKYTLQEEIIDIRDFVIGEKHAGAYINFDKGNRIRRVPYLLPYMCPTTRANILNPVKFSELILKMNYSNFMNTELYNNEVNNIRVNNVGEYNTILNELKN